MDGDLKGLRRMKQWAKEDPDERRARILRKSRLRPQIKNSYSNGSRRQQRRITPVREPKAKKAATRAKAKPAKIDHAAVDAKRAKAYGEMENSVCDLSRAAEMAMTVFDMTGFSCSPSVNSISWCSGSRIDTTRNNSPATTDLTTTRPASVWRAVPLQSP
jgi:hypothetical protein